MKFSLVSYVEDCKEYCKKLPHYDFALSMVQSQVAKSDCLNFLNKVRNIHKKYPNTAFYLVYSNTDSHGDCVKQTIKTGKRGRPRTIISGKLSVDHLHILMLIQGIKEDCEAVKADMKEFQKKQMSKHPYLKNARIENIHSVIATAKYMDRQATESRTVGDFDISLYRHPLCDDSCNDTPAEKLG